MQFDLSPELAELQATVRKLAQEKVAPRAREIDTTADVPAGPLRALPRRRPARPRDPRGVRRLRAPGSSGLTLAIEEVAKYSNTAALDAAAHPPADRAGADRGQRGAEAAVRRAASRPASMRAGFGLSEPQAGSDVVGMRTKAVRDGDDWVLTGTKCWMSGVVQADWYCVFAKTGPADSRKHDDISCFIVERIVAGRLGRPHRRQDGRARRRHRRADPRRRARAGRERRRRGRRLPARDARPQLDAADRRRARHRARRGRADVRGRVREAARRVRQARSPTCRASSGRSPSSRPRSKRRACSRTAPR